MPDYYGAGDFLQEAFAGVGQPAGSRAERCFTVSEINRYINGLMKSDRQLQDIRISGEVSNYRPHYSGHLYFTLKDNACALRCVMFRSAAARLRFTLENGQNIIVNGNISVFERDGQYQLYCEDIHIDGIGDLYAAYEQMKKRLSEEGLFAQQRKKPLPLLPRSVCVVTSPTGAVIRDIINISVRRFPMAVIKLLPVQVQGAAAGPQIARAIAAINEKRLADVIIVARGGGSLEDLWAFNEEAVARAISDSDIPVVSAVGHETDYTICDFVSDLRAPTPSAAAELVFPEATALRERVEQNVRHMRFAIQKKLAQAKLRLERCESNSVFKKPTLRVEYARMRLIGAEDKLISAVRSIKERNMARVAVLSAKLNALSPLLTLARGYAVISDDSSGAMIKKVGDAAAGQQIKARLQDGALRCKVLEVYADSAGDSAAAAGGSGDAVDAGDKNGE